MPRKRVHGHTRNNSAFNPDRLTRAQHTLLTWGIVLSGTESEVGFDHNSDEGEFRARMLWNLHRASILQEHRDAHDVKNPGGRPAAFWKYDVKKEIPHNKRFTYLKEQGFLDPWEIEAAKLFNQQIGFKHFDI